MQAQLAEQASLGNGHHWCKHRIVAKYGMVSHDDHFHLVMVVWVRNLQKAVPVKELLLKLHSTFLLHVVGAGRFDVNLVCMGDEEIRDLNRSYRKVNSATDVLSFPYHEVLLQTVGGGGRSFGLGGGDFAGHTLSERVALYNATVCSRPHESHGVLPPKRICGLRTVRPHVHSAATISQNSQLHCNVPDPECEGMVSETRGSPSNRQLKWSAE